MSDSFFDGIEDAIDGKASADQEAADAPKYDPKVGETLNGILLTAKAFTGGQYDPTVVITFRNVGEKAIGGVDAGESGSMFLPTVLRRKMLEAQPAVGTPFALRFEGVPEGKSYKDWTLLTSYMKSAEASDVDAPMWHGIQQEMAAAPVQRRAAAEQSAEDWKF